MWRELLQIQALRRVGIEFKLKEVVVVAVALGRLLLLLLTLRKEKQQQERESIDIDRQETFISLPSRFFSFST